MVEVLERGDISFFFRPRVQPADPRAAPTGAPGVQSLFFVLSTAGDRHRRVRVGRKRMPVAAGERLWARVERVGSLQRVLADQLEAEEYSTKTRGDRYQPGARPVGQGCYAFARHDDHVHLVYRILQAEPDVPDEVQVPEAGSDLVLFERVPRERAVWTTAGEPALLDEEGAEIVIVGIAGADDDLGVDVLTQAAPAPGGPDPAADRVA
ncbi:MAG TPA: hypothetical protein VHW23_46955 [Kofleriaceae bacterium]|jgi:hypothetical protein|nr:hypothetical protein [Kofleriaceae bacterium]